MLRLDWAILGMCWLAYILAGLRSKVISLRKDTKEVVAVLPLGVVQSRSQAMPSSEGLHRCSPFWKEWRVDRGIQTNASYIKSGDTWQKTVARLIQVVQSVWFPTARPSLRIRPPYHSQRTFPLGTNVAEHLFRTSNVQARSDTSGSITQIGVIGTIRRARDEVVWTCGSDGCERFEPQPKDVGTLCKRPANSRHGEL